MRDFLHSEISQIYGIANIPDFPENAINCGTRLCSEVLEPIQSALGRISIRSGYRSPGVNAKGAENRNQYSCARDNRGRHTWDYRDKNGNLGATACIVVNSFIPYYEETGHWQALAWWIHHHIPGYSEMVFFPKYAAFNIRWCEKPEKSIKSFVEPRGKLTTPESLSEHHKAEYREYLEQIAV
jgi:hypothetical protein